MYQECNDIFEGRKVVIDQFWYDEYCKDAAIAETLWSCVSDIQSQISNKIHWSCEENVKGAMVEQQQQQPQQQQQFVQGASSSSAPRVVQQQQLPHLDQFQLSFEENVAADDGGWNSDKERELSRLEAQLEAEKFANYSTYDNGYGSDNSQTWDHPDYN